MTIIPICLHTHTLPFGTEITFVSDRQKNFSFSDGQPSGKIMSLGKYDSDYGWEDNDKESEEEEKKDPHQSIENMKHHRQFYTNGTECELNLNRKQRKTEVRVRTTDFFWFSSSSSETIIFSFFHFLVYLRSECGRGRPGSCGGAAVLRVRPDGIDQ